MVMSSDIQAALDYLRSLPANDSPYIGLAVYIRSLLAPRPDDYFRTVCDINVGLHGLLTVLASAAIVAKLLLGASTWLFTTRRTAAGTLLLSNAVAYLVLMVVYTSTMIAAIRAIEDAYLEGGDIARVISLSGATWVALVTAHLWVV